MTPLDGQIPVGDDPFARGHRRGETHAEGASGEADRRTSAGIVIVGPSGERYAKVPSAAIIWLAPFVFAALGVGGKAALDRAAAPIAGPDDRVAASVVRIDRLETQFSERCRSEDERWRRVEQALDSVNAYLLAHAGNNGNK